MCAITSQAGTLPKSIRCPRKVTVLNNYYLRQWLNQRTASVYSFACHFFIWRITHNTTLTCAAREPSRVMKRGDIEKCAKAQSTAQKIEGTRVCREIIFICSIFGARIAIASAQLFWAKITMCAHDFVLLINFLLAARTALCINYVITVLGTQSVDLDTRRL